MKIVYIYCLKHPETNEIRYIGKTTNLKRRLYQHIYFSDKKYSKTRSSKWINSLIKKDLKPIIEIIEICNENNWEEKEKYWIKYYSNIVDLCNILEGGLGTSGNKVTLELKDKIRNAGYKRSYFSEEEKLKIWLKIKNNISFNSIKLEYPKFTKSSFNGIKNGSLWNHITNIPKIKHDPKNAFNNQRPAKKVICSETNIIYESAKKAWFEIYQNKYKYNYFRCMLSGHDNNKTTLKYI